MNNLIFFTICNFTILKNSGLQSAHDGILIELTLTLIKKEIKEAE